jgi:hypothetical protein
MLEACWGGFHGDFLTPKGRMPRHMAIMKAVISQHVGINLSSARTSGWITALACRNGRCRQASHQDQ